MKTIKQHWHLVLFTLLLGLITTTLSSTAAADAASDYNGATLHCVNCHGTPVGTGTFKFTKTQLQANFASNADLAHYIQLRMPKDAVGLCDDVCASAMADYLVGYEPPVVNIIPDTTLGVAPFAFRADGVAFGKNGNISPVLWNFGDGTTASTISVTHTYNSAGTYTVTLTAVDSTGISGSISKKVTVVNVHSLPVVNTSKSTNLSGVAPLVASFDASLSSCNDGCTIYNWNFADGSNSGDGPQVTHTFNAPGTYNVSVTVYDGASSPTNFSQTTANVTVTVTASSRVPKANASKSPNTAGVPPLNAQFDGSLSTCDNSCSTYAWNFGDGTSSSDTTPTASHTYNNVGTYNASLTVTDKSNGKKTTTPVVVKVSPAEPLSTYVQQCQTDLNFQPANVPNFDCYDGDIFAISSDFGQNSQVRDFLGYKKITDQVDATFVCRWLLGGDKTNRQSPISIELLLHNRQNGNTCFFSAKGPLSDGTSSSTISTQMPSPTSGAAATAFWDSPGSVDTNVRCIGCHVSGPYIATPTIAPFLAKYGLLNNGHDTLSNVAMSDLNTPNQNVKYHAVSGKVNNVPGAFSQWDSLKQSYIDPSRGCSEGCHLIGTLSPQADIVRARFFTVLRSPINELNEINHAYAMEPFDDNSDYRWVNLHIPVDGVETENLVDAKSASGTLVPALLSNCDAPAVMEAHVVGSQNNFVVTQPSRFASVPDKLAIFNLKDGLVCLNSDQNSGQCQDYKVRYECTNNSTGAKSWVDTINHTLRSDGDHEERPANVCGSNATATSIQASVTVGGKVFAFSGPNDRLTRMSQYGLTCNAADQPDGQCSNYVVRFSSCGMIPPTTNKTLTNVFAVGRQLTATGTANNALTKGQPHNNAWNTQQWALEPVANTEYVRLKNTGTNTYLNVPNQNESAELVTYTLDLTWGSMEWLVEPVPGSSDVRFKNVWTGKYLTMADPKNFPNSPNYLPVYSQTLNTGWTSQRWILQ